MYGKRDGRPMIQHAHKMNVLCYWKSSLRPARELVEASVHNNGLENHQISCKYCGSTQLKTCQTIYN